MKPGSNDKVFIVSGNNGRTTYQVFCFIIWEHNLNSVKCKIYVRVTRIYYSSLFGIWTGAHYLAYVPHTHTYCMVLRPAGSYCMVVLRLDINGFTSWHIVGSLSIEYYGIIKKCKQVVDTPLSASTDVITDVINNSHLWYLQTKRQHIHNKPQ